MLEIKTVEIKNALGLHARAAAKLVSLTNQYKSKIVFERDGIEANGKSLLSVLTLACPRGSQITIKAEGSDAHKAIKTLEELIEDKFGEE
jgi:phosphocarrier protein